MAENNPVSPGLKKDMIENSVRIKSILKWRRYTKLPCSTKPLVEGVNPSELKKMKYPDHKDFKGFPYGIVDFTTGTVTKTMTQEEYDGLFKKS